MLEHEFEKHAEELKASTAFYLTKYREKVSELQSLGIQIETSTKGVVYFFPVTEVKYIDIMIMKIT